MVYILCQSSLQNLGRELSWYLPRFSGSKSPGLVSQPRAALPILAWILIIASDFPFESGIQVRIAKGDQAKENGSRGTDIKYSVVNSLQPISRLTLNFQVCMSRADTK